MSWFLFAVGTFFPLLAAIASWVRGPALGAKSRTDGALAILDGAAALALMRALVPWVELGVWLWWIPVGLLAVAVAGLLWTWAERPAWRAGRSRRRSVTWAVGHALVALGIVGFVLL